jgi:hypothetical protein
MTHLTDEQLEDILQNKGCENAHLSDCETCQSRLKEKQALKARLSAAFSQVAPPVELAQAIRSQIASSAQTQDSHAGSHTQKLPHHWKRWAASLSSIAAVLILAALIKVALVPTPVYAGLVEIHEHNMSEGHDFLAQTDPNALANHFREQLGFNPRLPELGHGMELRGCCIKHFRGKIVGSYVVDTPQGIISVVAVEDEPALLGITASSQSNGQTYYYSQFAKCDMAAIRIDNYTYCAVGEVSPLYLQSLLEELLPEEAN